MKKFFAIALALVMMMTASFAMADAIKVGVIGPMTGAYAVYGLAVQYGAQIAADEINAKGGLQFEVLAEDDQGDGELGVNAYNKLLDDGVTLMLSNVTSGSCAVVADVANEERVFMLTPSGSADAITEGKDNIYRVCFKDSSQGLASAQYIVDHNLATKVGVIYNNSIDYSMGIYNSFKAKAAELGLNLVAESTFSSEDNADFSVQIAAMKEAGAELVFLPIYYTPASLILVQCDAIGYKPTFFGVDGMDGILSLEGFDKNLAEGVMLLTPFSADAEDERTQNFVKTYQDTYGETPNQFAADERTQNFVKAYQAAYGDIPNQFAADAYDGVYIMKAALEAAGCTADMSSADICEAVVSVMTTISVDGLTGQGMTWAESGEVSKAPMAVVIENGVYVLP